MHATPFKGAELTKPSAIKKEAGHFFQALLKSPNESAPIPLDLNRLIGYRCPSTKAESLVASVTETEIKKALFLMPSNKSSGPDDCRKGNGDCDTVFLSLWSHASWCERNSPHAYSKEDRC